MENGKRKFSPEEEEEEGRTIKRRAHPTPDGFRVLQANFEHPCYDPPYLGPAPTLQYGDQCELSQTLTSPDTSWDKYINELPQKTEYSASWSPWPPVRMGRPVFRKGEWNFVVPKDGSIAYMDELTFNRIKGKEVQLIMARPPTSDSEHRANYILVLGKGHILAVSLWPMYGNVMPQHWEFGISLHSSYIKSDISVQNTQLLGWKVGFAWSSLQYT